MLSFQYKREKNYRIARLETRLDNISGIASGYIGYYRMPETDNFEGLDTLKRILPDKDVRITVIDEKGEVKYDNFVADYQSMENHLQRPEVQKALYSESGSNIRYSETTGEDFYYFARYYGDFFVRCAVVYNVEVRNFLKTERIFIFFVIAMFVIAGGLLFLVTQRLGDFIQKLRDFAIRAGRNEVIDTSLELSDSEFGDIQNQIIMIYNNLRTTKDELTAEKEKLYNHLVALNLGIAFFTPEKEKILANSYFIQYINFISDRSSISTDLFFEMPEMQKIIRQVEKKLQPEVVISTRNLPRFEATVVKNEKYFSVQAIVFQDRSFEILISDVTKPEKRRMLKQQLTSNIAHELKTPLASIKGYLETIINNGELKREKIDYFANKAYIQCERLNVLLNDVSLLNNIEDAGDLFEFNEVKIKPLVNDVIENLESRLREKEIEVNVEIDSKAKVQGNDSLIASIFQNLVENSINYAGEKIRISIKLYLEDEKFYYFNYMDTGSGLPEEHLPRIFERFYRVDEGRTRESGGTGLGLAIVKNAVQLHKGDISARNSVEGGLEFIFSLAK
jgi:signal transduction histidine kinase